MTDDDWWNDYVFPLHAALDATMQLPAGTPKEKRLAVLVEKCPFLADLASPLSDLAIEDGADPAAHEPEWTPVASTNIDAFHLDRPTVMKGEKAALYIRFKNGAEWRYEDVPAETIAGFVDSASPGGYFAANIKGKYPETKLK